MDQFRKDVLLVFSNCKSYNQPGSAIYIDANVLEATFLAAWQRGKNGEPIVNLDALSLTAAVTKGDLKKVEAIIQRGDDVNTLAEVHESQFGTAFTWGPLHAACYGGNIKIIEALMEAGANVEIEDTWYHGVLFNNIRDPWLGLLLVVTPKYVNCSWKSTRRIRMPKILKVK